MEKIIKVTTDNYQQYDDLIYWRINRKEKTSNEAAAVPKELSNPNLYVYAIEMDDKFVSWISFVYVPKIGKKNNKGYLYVDELYVEPSYRSRGYAKLLLSKADDLCKTMCLSEIRLFVDPKNEKARKLYENMLYIKDSDAVYMKRFITS